MAMLSLQRHWKSGLFCLCAIAMLGCQGREVHRAELPFVKLNERSDSQSVILYQGPKTFGLYQWSKQLDYEDGLDREIESIGIRPTYVLYFTDLKREFPRRVLDSNRERGLRTVLSQEICVYDAPDNHLALDSLLAGRWDAFFTEFAREARIFQEPIYYRFGYEMNGNWVAWGEEPKKFRAAWDRVWRIFREEGADNVKWVFSPNVLWGNRTFESDILPYYAGDEQVDIVGLDGYNFGDNHSNHHVWAGYDAIFGPSLNGFRRHFPDKPMWITEIGCANDPRKAAWIEDFIDRFNADPDLEAFIWFNEDKQYAGEPNWRLDSDDASLQSFKRWAMDHFRINVRSLPQVTYRTGSRRFEDPAM